MSCFQCSNMHTVVIAMLANAPGVTAGAQIRETARILRALNDAALKARYGDSPDPLTRAEFGPAFLSAVDWVRNATHADMLAALKCFAYQCDEAPDDYPGRTILADTMARVSALPGAGGPSPVWSI